MCTSFSGIPLLKVVKWCFSNKLQQIIETTLQSGETLNNLGIVLSTDKPEDIFLESVSPSCEHVIKQVDECIK